LHCSRLPQLLWLHAGVQSRVYCDYALQPTPTITVVTCRSSIPRLLWLCMQPTPTITVVTCRSSIPRLLWLCTAADSHNYCGYMPEFNPAFTVTMHCSRLPQLLWLHAGVQSRVYCGYALQLTPTLTVATCRIGFHIYYDNMPETIHTFTVDVRRS